MNSIINIYNNKNNVIPSHPKKMILKEINQFTSHELVAKNSSSTYKNQKFTHVKKKENNTKREIAVNKSSHIKKSKNVKKKNNSKNYDNKYQNKENKMSFDNQKKFYYSKKGGALQQNFKKPNKNIIKNIILNKNITISELANKVSIKVSKLIKKMMKMGLIVTINQILDQETAQLVIEEMGHKAILRRENELEECLLNDRKIKNDKYITKIRPPIVTIMGHVDHGKTSLLDYIRSTKVASSESGGITQHIGAYHVKTKKGVITFLDTPGHAAFTKMRARGAQITDIVVLVIASDDGVKPQTIEAIQHAQAAKVPILIAINKIDKPESNPKKIQKELMKYNILSEEWGGENIFIHVSSKTGVGINNLLNAILLQSEILELNTIYSGMANGIVIESFLDNSRGPIATILIKQGILRKGDIVLCGLEYGKVRLIRDAFGIELKCAEPSIPVQILGLSGIPISGDIFHVVKNEKKAKEVSEFRKEKIREIKFSSHKLLNLENMFEHLKNSKNVILNIVLKCDVQGSLEAISNAINNLSNIDINIKIISKNVGGITETDVSLAMASNAIIIGFNVRSNILAKKMIALEHVDVRYYSVIYNLIDDIKLAAKGMLSPEYKEKIIGTAEVRNIFKISKLTSIAGVMVIDGIIKRKNSIHILRNNIIIYKGEIESLRRFKEDVKQVSSGKECGIGIKKYNDIHINDIIESFETVAI